MANEDGDLNTDYPHVKAVHKCISCGTASDRNDVSEEEMITGVLVCRVSGHTAPLRVVVVEA